MWKTRVAILLTMAMFLFAAGCGASGDKMPEKPVQPEKLLFRPRSATTTPLFKFAADGEIEGMKLELILYKSVEEATTQNR